MAEQRVDAYTQSLIDEGKARWAATMHPIGTLSSDEAQQHWDDKADAEKAAAEEADVKAKVVRAPRKAAPKPNEGAETK